MAMIRLHDVSGMGASDSVIDIDTATWPVVAHGRQDVVSTRQRKDGSRPRLTMAAEVRIYLWNPPPWWPAWLPWPRRGALRAIVTRRWACDDDFEVGYGHTLMQYTDASSGESSHSLPRKCWITGKRTNMGMVREQVYAMRPLWGVPQVTAPIIAQAWKSVCRQVSDQLPAGRI